MLPIAAAAKTKQKSNCSRFVQSNKKNPTIMPPYGEPDWASPGDTTNTATTSVVAAAPAANNSNSGEVRYVETEPMLEFVRWVIRELWRFHP